MMYQEKFIAVVKCNGKILREQNQCEVHLPFGSEYSLLFKNLDSRRVSVNVSIDGTDILYGSSLVIDANSEGELERFLDKVTHGNKLKFIEKTEQISEHRGDRVDDGIIRIEYAFEKLEVPTWIYSSYPAVFDSCVGAIHNTTVNYCSTNIKSPEISINEVDMSMNADCGITVPGSESQQAFSYTLIGDLEDSKVLVFVLKGITQQGKVTKPLSVKTKIKCTTCGSNHKSTMKFCSNCGTVLTIV
jgi:hypothetical protein